jgi:uncharacterized membrane protein YfcA
MGMTVPEVLGLMAAAAAGGAINAVAGGGTIITFPTLLFFGTPPVVANATSTLALVIGTSGSIYGYRTHLPAIRTWLWRFIPVSLTGGLLGSILLTQTSEKVFARLVPFLILFATLLFMTQGLFRRLVKVEERWASSHHMVWPAIVFQFLVAIYGGYFGAGIGILMLATLGYIGLHNIHEMNSLKTTLGSLINVVAAVWFIIAGLIDWPRAGVMTLGAVAGYFLGAHFSQRISQARVRQLITAIGLVLSLITFYQEFLHRR